MYINLIICHYNTHHYFCKLILLFSSQGHNVQRAIVMPLLAVSIDKNFNLNFHIYLSKVATYIWLPPVNFIVL